MEVYAQKLVSSEWFNKEPLTRHGFTFKVTGGRTDKYRFGAVCAHCDRTYDDYVRNVCTDIWNERYGHLHEHADFVAEHFSFIVQWDKQARRWTIRAEPTPGRGAVARALHNRGLRADELNKAL